MANNIDVTPGTGKTVASEEISSVQYQKVKLVDATASSTTGTGIAANPLQVSLANTAANATAVKVDGSAVTQPVSAASLPLPTGASTAAKQPALGTAGTASADVISVQGIASMTPLLATVTNAGTFAAQVTSVVPGTGATNLGKAEDAAHASGDVGVMSLVVRSDAGGSLSGTDGDYSPLQVDANGALRVTGGGGGTQYTEDAAAAANPIGTALIGVRDDARAGGIVSADGDNIAMRATNAGELFVSATTPIGSPDSIALEEGGNLEGIAILLNTVRHAEDGASADGDFGFGILAVRQDTPANTSGTDGDYEIPKMSAGRLWTSAKIDTALPAGTNAIGKLAANSGVDIGDVDVTSVPADPFGVNADAASATGSISAKLRFIASTGIPITGTVTVASHAVTNAGTFAVQESGTQVQVDDAAFTPATGKIVMQGFLADESSTDSVDEGDGGAARITLDRKQIVTVEPHTAGGCLVANMTSGDTFTALTNSAQVIKASAGQLYGWYIYNPNATAMYVNIYNVAAASVTVGTTTPLMNIVIPPTSAANILGAVGIEFTNAGFSASATTTGGGNTAPGTALEANFFYK